MNTILRLSLRGLWPKQSSWFTWIASLSLAMTANTALAHHTHLPTVTDRPDAAEASVTVGPNHFQMETSFGFSQDKDASVTTRTYSFPTLLRYGVGNRLEFRTEGELGVIRTRTNAGTDAGFTDQAFGAKLHLVENKGVVPSLSLLAHANTPTGRNTFSANGIEPLVKVLTDWELPADFAFAANNGVDVPVKDEQGDKFARYLYAASVGHPMPVLAERWNIFAEVQGAVPLHPGKASEHTFDTGFTFRLTNNIQIDSFVQIGIVDAAPDLTTGFGFSWRSL